MPWEVNTIIGGVVTYIFGQFILKLTIEPIQEYNKVRGEIANSILYFAGYLTSPGNYPDIENVSKAIRKLSTRLIASVHMIYGYRLFAFLWIVPNYDQISEASSQLTFLSNNVAGIPQD